MDYLYTKKTDMVCNEEKVLLRGMGLGNWLLPEGYMWKFYTKCDRPRRIEGLISHLCGDDYAGSFWKKYYDNYITEKDIEWIKAQGLNSVRIPVNARHMFWVDTNLDVYFQMEMINKLDQCISWCKKNNIYVFIDMHAAPGGQTGTNIDDSKENQPELFLNEIYEELLIKCWKLLADRYKEEPTVGGYDLLNEPLPEWNKQYNGKVLPLYRSLLKNIREIDKKHIIVLEGTHWSTDFSIFSELKKGELGDNILLEFHKYWNNPDTESLKDFMDISNKLEMPLWMGEGGENNLDWYTTAFPMYERNGIGWCFWSYKKMDTKNSPVSFEMPYHWQKILNYLDDNADVTREEACKIFDEFLESLKRPVYQEKVIHALLRRGPLEIPAYAYDAYVIKEKRIGDVKFRSQDMCSICFEDLHVGEPDWKRYGGEEQPSTEKMFVKLNVGDELAFAFTGKIVQIDYAGDGKIEIKKKNDGLTWLCCQEKPIQLRKIVIE